MDERLTRLAIPIRLAIETCAYASPKAAEQNMAKDALRYAEAARNLAETLATLHSLDNTNP